jgi:PAS domain S-box-containing protein
MGERSSAELPLERATGLDERFCEVMDAAPVMIWVSGQDKGCVWFNRPWLLFTGRSMRQELGNGWTEGVHPDDFERCLEIYNHHFEERKEFRMQYRLRRNDGAYHWIDDVGIPRYKRDGGFLGYVGSCTDVMHLKATETALRESELRLRFALEAAAMGTFEVDIAATQAIIDAQEAHLLDLPESTRAVSVDELRKRIPFEDLRTSDAKHKRLIENNEAYQHEFRLRLPDGSERWLSGHAAVRSNRIFGVNFDITERKRLERESQALSDRLINLQEKERQRIAQELHDSTTQHLVAANLTLMSLRRRLALTKTEAKLWDEVETSLGEVFKEIRTLSYLLHPLGLDVDGFCSTIGRYIDGYAERSGLVISIRSNPKADKLPRRTQRALFRMVQEGLANVHRHAFASRVSVQLRWIGTWVHLIITDDGRGVRKMRHGLPMRMGVGLRGIQSRARQFGGDLKIRTGLPGTRIHVVINSARGIRRNGTSFLSKDGVQRD